MSYVSIHSNWYQWAEAAIGVAVLNRMIDAGRPDSIRIA
jgi:hypothetical protein